MVVLAKVCNLSVDDQGAWQDNVSIERVWRDVKPGPLYPKAYDRVRAARADVGEYRAWKNISSRRSPSWETLHLWSLARCPSSIGDGRLNKQTHFRVTSISYKNQYVFENIK